MEDQPKSLLGNLATVQVHISLSKESIREAAYCAVAAAILFLVLSKLLLKHL